MGYPITYVRIGRIRLTCIIRMLVCARMAPAFLTNTPLVNAKCISRSRIPPFRLGWRIAGLLDICGHMATFLAPCRVAAIEQVSIPGWMQCVKTRQVRGDQARPYMLVGPSSDAIGRSNPRFMPDGLALGMIGLRKFHDG